MEKSIHIQVGDLSDGDYLVFVVPMWKGQHKYRTIVCAMHGAPCKVFNVMSKRPLDSVLSTLQEWLMERLALGEDYTRTDAELVQQAKQAPKRAKSIRLNEVEEEKVVQQVIEKIPKTIQTQVQKSYHFLRMNFETDDQEEVVYVNVEKNLQFSKYNANYHTLTRDKSSLTFKMHAFHRSHCIEAKVKETGLDGFSVDSIRQHLSVGGTPISKRACINITFRSESKEFTVESDEDLAMSREMGIEEGDIIRTFIVNYTVVSRPQGGIVTMVNNIGTDTATSVYVDIEYSSGVGKNK